MRFEFATAARIVFGCGATREIAPTVRQFGARPLLVTGSSPKLQLDAAAIVRVHGEPTVDLVRNGAAMARGCDVVVSIGGGSAIDAGKAIAALLANGGDPLDYLEVVGRGMPLAKPSLPFIAVPTTAGAGAEVTRNAVLASTEHRVKASLRSPHMLARVAIVDPELTAGLPPEVTAATGLDALTQLIEPYVSARANAMTDMFCTEGIRRVLRSLRRAVENGGDLAARTDMSFAALLGGLALANAGLGAVHGFAAPIGGRFDAAHGAVCAALLPHVIEVNMRALRSRAPESEALGRYESLDIQGIARLCAALPIPPLRAYGIRESDIPGLCAEAARASSMKANPIALEPGELDEILRGAL